MINFPPVPRPKTSFFFAPSPSRHDDMLLSAAQRPVRHGCRSAELLRFPAYIRQKRCYDTIPTTLRELLFEFAETDQAIHESRIECEKKRNF